MPTYNNQDDYEDYDDEGFRWMSVVVLLLAVAGFFSLAWYAYNNSADQAMVQDVIVIEGDDAPFKMAPADPGGMEFPHQDKTIYNVLDEGTASLDADMSDVMNAPEAPIMPSKGDMEALFAEEKNAARVETFIASDDPELEEKAAALEKILDQPVKDAPKAAQASKPETVTTYVAPKPQPKPTPTKVVPPKKPVTKAPVTTSQPQSLAPNYRDSYKVQLGAFRSQADAQAQWNKVRKSHMDVLNNKPNEIVRADLGAKGVYYRLRVGGMPSADAAKKLCKSLEARKQPCLYVGK